MSVFRATGIIGIIAICGGLAYFYSQQHYNQIFIESLTGNPSLIMAYVILFFGCFFAVMLAFLGRETGEISWERGRIRRR